MKILKDLGISKTTIDFLKQEGFDSYRKIAILNLAQINEIFSRENVHFSTISDAVHKADLSLLTNQMTYIPLSGSPISTGIVSLDNILMGGLYNNNSYLFYGEFKTGKSQIAHQLIITALRTPPKRKNDKIIFIDTEGTFRPERINDICETEDLKSLEIMEKVKVFKITKIDDFLLILPSIETICADNRVKLIIIDSLMHHFRVELGDDKKEYHEILRILKTVLKELKSLSKQYSFPLYYTSPISSSNKEMYYSVRPILPNILSYYIDHWVLLSINEQIPDIEDRVVRNAVIVKSIVLPEKSAEFIITKEGVKDYC